VHDIPDGSELIDPFDTDSDRIWAEENGVNILGTPLGSSSFISGYLKGKGLKHHLLLRFVKEVAETGGRRLPEGGGTDAQGSCNTSPVSHSEISTEERQLGVVDDGDG
jgi:hypothetical protein